MEPTDNCPRLLDQHGAPRFRQLRGATAAVGQAIRLIGRGRVGAEDLEDRRRPAEETGGGRWMVNGGRKSKPSPHRPLFTLHYSPGTVHRPLSTVHCPPSTSRESPMKSLQSTSREPGNDLGHDRGRCLKSLALAGSALIYEVRLRDDATQSRAADTDHEARLRAIESNAGETRADVREIRTNVKWICDYFHKDGLVKPDRAPQTAQNEQNER